MMWRANGRDEIRHSEMTTVDEDVMAIKEGFEDAVEVTPVVMTLEAVLSGAIEDLPRGILRALEADDYSGALAAANQAYSTRGPEERDVALAYAVLLVGRHLVDEARGVLRRALKHHAQDVGLQLAQCEALVMEGNFESALDLLDGLRAVSTLEPRHMGFVGDLYLDMDRVEEAVDCYRQALDRGLESPETAYRLALLLEDEDELAAAAHYLEMAARFAAYNATLWEMAAELLYEVGRVDDAVVAYEQMLEHRPYDPQAWFMLGLSYWYLDHFADAAVAFEKVLELNPRHRVAWRQLGQTYLSMGHGEKGLNAFRRALDLDGEDLEALNGAVRAAVEIGDVELAARWAEKAAQLAPEDRDSQYNLAVVSLSLGRAEKALEVLRQLVSSGDGRLGTYLGTLAVAELMAGYVDEAFEHIGEAQRRDVEPQWLAAFAEELLRSQGTDEAIEFLERADSNDGRWALVRPLMGFVCSALGGDEERGGKFVEQFRAHLDEVEELLPLFWDLENWEAMAFRLERRFERTFDAMLDVLEGRCDPEEFDSLVE